MANQNELLVYGWTVQSNVASGEAGPGYAQPGSVPIQASTVASALEASGGNGFSPAGTGAYGSNPVLSNPGYAASPALMTPGPVTPPTATPVSGTAYANPYGLPVSVTLSDATPADLSVVAIAPAGSNTFATVLTGPGTCTIPAGGQIKLTWTTVQPTWTWTVLN